jgi:hypothetical protein
MSLFGTFCHLIFEKGVFGRQGAIFFTTPGPNFCKCLIEHQKLPLLYLFSFFAGQVRRGDRAYVSLDPRPDSERLTISDEHGEGKVS